MSERLNTEAKTIIARLYAENGGSDLSFLPPWISHEDALAYVEHLRNDTYEADRLIRQDNRSRALRDDGNR